MKKRMISTAQWGASLTPPVCESRARALAPKVTGAKRVGVGGRWDGLIPEGAAVKRNPVGRPKINP